MPVLLVELFSRYGYAVIFLGVVLENAGVPAPGHTVLLGGGFLAQQGTLSLPIVFAVGCSAAILGGEVGFRVGRRHGTALIDKHRRLLHFSEARQRTFADYFHKHDVKAMFAARFLVGVQTVIALFAGMSGMSWRRYCALNAASAVVWCSVYAAVGYVFGKSWDVMHEWISRAGEGAVALIIIGVGVLWALRRLAKKKLELIPEEKDHE